MKQIKIKYDLFAIVDDEDFDHLSQFSWFVHAKRYAVRNLPREGGKQRQVLMHHDVIGKKIGFVTDHINGNGFDNRRVNLRFCFQKQNLMNRERKLQSKSGFKGVVFSKKSEKWQAQIGIGNKKNIYLGLFVSKIEAALAYNSAAIKYHGQFARLNII